MQHHLTRWLETASQGKAIDFAMLGQSLAGAVFRLSIPSERFSLCFQCKLDSTLVLRRPFETTMEPVAEELREVLS
jgi:hypothetical protein